MNKTVFCLVACVFLAAAAIAANLQCYQCNPATEECADNKADVITCGDASTSKCSRQVKKDATDKTKALRKCVIPDKAGYVNCPNGYECVHCNENLCNANPVVTPTTLAPATTPAPGSAPVVKSAWSAVVAVTVASFYL